MRNVVGYVPAWWAVSVRDARGGVSGDGLPLAGGALLGSCRQRVGRRTSCAPYKTDAHCCLTENFLSAQASTRERLHSICVR